MQTILIIGLGLIGGSLAKALKNQHSNIKIFSHDKCENSLKQAKEENIIENEIEITEKINDFDLIIIAAPLKEYQNIFDKLSEFNVEKPIIIDIGSVKNLNLRMNNQKILQNFIACHPIAGKEVSSYKNSDENLFKGKKFIICKKDENKDSNIKAIEDLALDIGLKPEILNSKIHDEIFALTSHLPQFLSFLTSDMIIEAKNSELLTKSFRLNSSNAKIWQDIFDMNASNIEKYYIEFFENLMILAEDINQGQESKALTRISDLNFNCDKNINKKDLQHIFLDQKNDEEIAKILFRFLIVASYLQILDHEKYQEYCSSGFKDFTIIMNLVLLDKSFLAEKLQKSKKYILKFIDNISL